MADMLQSQVSDSQSTQYHEETEPLVSLGEAPAYISTLSKARGAPAPLTAGPPGVRQLRPATFEQDILQRAREFDDENPMMNPYHMRLPLSHRIDSPSFEDASTSPALTAAVEEDLLPNTKDDKSNPLCDTLSIDEALEFYPDGLPLNFNTRTQPVPYDWELERLKQVNRSYSDQNVEFWAARSRDIDNHFYSGVNALNKTFERVVSEHKHRSIAHVVGGPYKELASNQGKVINRELQINNASLMPTSEQYELLSIIPSTVGQVFF
jgi:hypothetical protein